MYAQSEGAGLPDDDALDVDPVASARGERLENDKILGRAREQRHVTGEPERRRPTDQRLLEGQAAERDVDTDAGPGAQQQHAVGAREAGRVVDPACVSVQQRRDERFLASEPGEQRHVDVDGLSRLSPTLHRQPADEAEAPVPGFTEVLQVRRHPDQLKHEGMPPA